MNNNDSPPVAGQLSVSLIGAGLIGVDLMTKIMRSKYLDLQLVVGRDEASSGLRQAAGLGVPVAARGVQSLLEADQHFDVIFDATNAASHVEHSEKLAHLDTMLIDLTPSRVGQMIIPTVNRVDIAAHRDISMVTCGGQTSVPILHAIAKTHEIDYIEVVTTAATLSVGPGTRVNIDEYVETTQAAVRRFTGVQNVKAILNISPAQPPATFRVAMSLLGRDLTLDSVRAQVRQAASEVRSYAVGFDVTACTVNDGRAFVAVQVTSSGDHIPLYAGNLDIINAAAVQVAESYAADRLSMASTEIS